MHTHPQIAFAAAVATLLANATPVRALGATEAYFCDCATASRTGARPQPVESQGACHVAWLKLALVAPILVGDAMSSDSIRQNDHSLELAWAQA